jgi:hypothetical protein
MKKLVLATLLAVSSFAHAEFLDGNDLYSRLTSSSRVSEMYAIGFIVGVHDASSNSVCTPDTITVGQLADTVRVRLGRWPEHRHLSAWSLVFAIIQDVWPCPSKLPNGGRL